ncbi:uncharacterized protein PGTG_01007 [Puccinia graminis f. sp. tritici CRL 75-36-700-3]|uniref:Alpha-type protein kinase domain-containing protein n=1 Tax=Puccinia graminis f. sp. tritici (strain CRL 75-36-700-3 / race SCCL) TaxID=418459 RepID=E3JUF1_PUCGT|nr:uncharacterized protein PGTG_01007 [Puccinia graminis f. sp. tritici CRL 75-36-700-3]EFP75676.2 hypothetical protein PGTG_01007 [Puccinia graminis f. sp. tritici CRL 75-36-700-3]
MNSDGWIVAQRLVFEGIEKPKTRTDPIIIQVNKQEVIGTGGMRITYAAQVKSIDEDEVEVISDYVAKVMKDPEHQDLTRHATDARMYEACALLLAEYRSVVHDCRILPMSTKAKAKQMQIIRHSVVFTGDLFFPTDVYFFEKRLTGPYVKYSSNTDFNISPNQPGMDPKILQLMNTFTHWTYNTSEGKNLVGDLQGVGPLITDPQILDMNENLWTLGNNSADGIQAFIKDHICNEVCQAIGLPPPLNTPDHPGPVASATYLWILMIMVPSKTPVLYFQPVHPSQASKTQATSHITKPLGFHTVLSRTTSPVTKPRVFLRGCHTTLNDSSFTDSSLIQL